jgi:YesN/AraC family two-component response regulator
MKKILVVDNEHQDRETLLKCLEVAGFQAIGTETGGVGLQITDEWQPDIILCEINLPDRDGFEILATLRQNPLTTTIPFIFLTTQATKADYRRGMELGADDYLTKPCPIAELLNAIATRLERQAQLAQCYATAVHTAPATAVIADNSSIFPAVPSQLKVVFDFLESHYSEEIGLKEIAQAVGYSPAYLTHLVRKQTGRSIHAWLIQRRMSAASYLLIETDQSVDEISRSVGYLHVCNFFRQFRQQYGKTPKAWRRENRCRKNRPDLPQNHPIPAWAALGSAHPTANY